MHRPGQREVRPAVLNAGEAGGWGESLAALSLDAMTDAKRGEAAPTARPRIVCLCGSVRFLAAFDAASLTETLAGHIVLSIGSHRQRG